jgi:acyl transferase domain-containing protein
MGTPAASFAPIAIVGQGCVLPGATDPAALWSILVEGRSVVDAIPDGRWRVDRQRMLISAAQRAAGAEGCLTDRGGWVTGFALDPAGLAIDPAVIARLDPLVGWLLHAGRAALNEAGMRAGEPALARAGAIFGHLAYPTTGLAAFAEACWLGQERPDPRNRFNAGLPADLLCQGLGLGAGGFTLDAACASSLYAVKLACDRLQAGEVDMMLAGGISRIDPLVLHAGFTALGALSASGRSRPFHAEADGLLPAEGAALLALKRLEDAEAAGDRVLAVILGVGLSNDGRDGGLLAPSVDGQARAMERAFASAGIEPGAVSLIECHATGTLLGDAAEMQSTGRVYAGQAPLPVGSIKSNFGHLTTASGAAGLMKMVLALRHGVRPPTLQCDRLAESVVQSRFRPVMAAEVWPDEAPRVAAISNFGFGGANAHLLLGDVRAVPRRARPKPSTAPAGRVAVVAIGARVADGAGLEDFRNHLFAGVPRGPAVGIGFRLGEIRFPPRDLERTLPQHLLLLRAALDAVADLALPPQTGVFVGAQTDPEGCRPGFRLRLAGDRATRFPLDAAGVVGAMPNIPANRVNMQLDLLGASFVVAAEELSGLRALDLAVRALLAGEVDAALAGAVDLSVEPVHAAALKAVAPDAPRPGDAAIVLVLKREADARRDGNAVLALIDQAGAGDALDWAPHAARVAATFGHAHAASGLVQAVAAIVAVNEGLLPPDGPGAAARPWPGARRVRVRQRGLGGQEMSMGFDAPGPHAPGAALRRYDTLLQA